MDGLYDATNIQGKQQIYKVPQYTRQFETRTLDKPRLGSSPDEVQSVRYSTATGATNKSVLGTQMAQSNFARTKQGQEVLRRITAPSKFCMDYTKAAREASPDCLSKLGSLHSQQREHARLASGTDRMQYTGVSAFSQGKNSGKNAARETNIESNMEAAHLRFAVGVEKARQWEAAKDHEQEQHRIAGIKRQQQIH